MGRLINILALLFVSGLFAFQTEANSWPRTITTEKAEITIYQPQPESLEGASLSGRAAISVKVEESEPVFGAIWITANLETDRETRISTLADIQVPNIRFADKVDEENLDKLRNLLEREIPKWEITVSIDEIITTIEEQLETGKESFNNAPPEIIISYKPSILVFIDGDPILKDLEGQPYQRVENSPYFILFDAKTKEYYLFGEQLWYSSNDLRGTWTMLKNPDSKLKKIQKELEKSSEEGEPAVTSKTSKNPTVADIIVRTEPAELIQIDGEPNLIPVKGTDLLYVKNSTDNILLDIASQKYYILVSGRWYSATNLGGTWEFVDSENLPASFAGIAEGSDIDAVLASIPGTDASREAVLDAQIPQTAEVERKTATVKVEYDGDPEFQKVEGTDMYFAVNSPQTILRVSNHYYCVDNGIWFESANATGPWSVATERPEEVKDIKPSSPVYNVKYVHIYNVTPTYVRVGYTPGYYGSYVYGRTVIYGTGYYYRPWYRIHYYPRPVTYGFRMSYNPWTGWSMHVGFSHGTWFYRGYGGIYHGRYWGVVAYRPPVYYRSYRPPYYGPTPRPVYNTGPRPSRDKIYSSRPGVRPTVVRPLADRTGRTRETRPVNRNNVYTDRNGRVYQQTNRGWETRENNSWKPIDNSGTRNEKTRPVSTQTQQQRPASGTATRPAPGRENTVPTNRGALENSSHDRMRSQQRMNNYHRAAPTGSGKSTRSPAQQRSGNPSRGKRR